MKKRKGIVGLLLGLSVMAFSTMSSLSVRADAIDVISTENDTYQTAISSETEEETTSDRLMTTAGEVAAPPISPESWGFDLDGALNSGLITHETYKDPITGKTLTYWFHAPADYKTKQYPVVLLMHGHGDGGANTQTNIRNHFGILYQLLNEQNQKDNPCIIISPQTPQTHDKWVDVPAWGVTGWDMNAIPRSALLNTVYDLYNDIQLKYNADQDRAYVTGLSMGGFATWDLITRDPGKFAAAAPICGAGDPSKASLLRKLPIWTFHGTQDDVVPVGSTRTMYNELNKYGNIKFTEYPAEKHSSWNSAYGKDNVQKLIDWMFAQNRKDQTEPDIPSSEVINVAQGSTVTATGGGDANRPLSMAVDGVIGSSSSSDNYGEFGTADGFNKKSRYMQIDLGSTFDLQKLKMWRYWDDSRKYDNTVIALSEDGDFTPGKATIVYNSDVDNKHGFGAGTDVLYSETKAGKEIVLESPLKARYIRIYMYGTGVGGSNHIVEFQAFAEKANLPTPDVKDEVKRVQDLINGDAPVQWVFAGDSITHACYWTNYYKGYSEYFSQRIKTEQIRGKVRSEDIVVNQGISGATTTYFMSDFNSWVNTKLDPKYPSIMFIAFGMNDRVQNNGFSKPLSVAQFTQNLNAMVDKIREAGGIPILQTPNPVKPVGDFYGCAERRPILDEYANVVRSVASNKGVILVDVNQHWKDQLSLGTDVFGEWMPAADGIHPDPFGHLEWAKFLFRELDIFDENSAVCSMTKEDIELTNDEENIHPDRMVLDSEKLTPERAYEPALQLDVNKYFTGKQLVNQSEDIESIKSLSEGTIAFRFKSTDGDGLQTIFSVNNKTKVNGTNVQLGVGTSGGGIYYFLSNGTKYLFMNTGNLGITDGRWHTVVLTNKANQTVMYVDGNKVSLTNSGTGYENNQFVAGLPGLDSMTIGGQIFGSQAGTAEAFFHGNISYIDVYSQIFTDAEAALRSKENVDTYALSVKSKVNELARNPWVFIGGETSIENQKNPSARNFIDHFQEVYRYEFANELRMHGFFINSSVSGKPLQYYVDNYEKTVKRFVPVFAVVTPDIFDSNLELVETSLEDFRAQLDTLLAKLKADNVITILQSPAMVGDPEKNELLGQYVEQITQAAKGKNLVYINNYAYFNSVAKNNPETTSLWLQDGKFPNETGQLEMARRLLTAIHYNTPGDSRVRTLTYAKGAESEQEGILADATVTGEGSVTLDLSKIKKNSPYVFDQFQVYVGSSKVGQVAGSQNEIKLTGLAKGKIVLRMEGTVSEKDSSTKTVRFTDIPVNTSPTSSVDKTDLKELIDQVKAIVLDKYTAESRAILEKALQEAQEVYDDANADQPAVDQSKDALQEALDGLILKKEMVTLTYKADAHGKIVGTANQSLEKGAQGSRVEAVADSGYKFSRWSDGSTQAVRTDIANEDAAYTAYFVQEVKPVEITLTYKADVHGKIVGTVIQKLGQGKQGSRVEAVADKGYKFSRWSDGSTQAVRTDKADKNATYTAYFVQEAKPEKPKAQSVKLSTRKLSIGVKEKVKLTAKVLPSGALQKVTWSSAHKSIVSVNQKGEIVGRKAGTATIKVRTSNGKYQTCKVRVYKAPTKVTLNAEKKTLKVGKKFKLKASLPRKTASYKMSYSSSNKSVATVSSSGVITAKKKGTVTIKVKTFNGKVDRIQVRVIK